MEKRMTFESHLVAVISAMEIAGKGFVVTLADASHVDEED